MEYSVSSFSHHISIRQYLQDTNHPSWSFPIFHTYKPKFLQLVSSLILIVSCFTNATLRQYLRRRTAYPNWTSCNTNIHQEARAVCRIAGRRRMVQPDAPCKDQGSQEWECSFCCYPKPVQLAARLSYLRSLHDSCSAPRFLWLDMDKIRTIY